MPFYPHSPFVGCSFSPQIDIFFVKGVENMDTQKIGAFIAENRRAKGLTQEQLAEKLGVTNKTVSRWETGKYMPDLSLLKPLSEELGITLNELLSGESIKSEHLEEQAETNILNAIDYSKEKLQNVHKRNSLFLMILGIAISFSSFIMFQTESSWCSFYSTIGIIVFMTGLFRELKLKHLWQKLCLSVLLFIALLTIFHVIDYVGVATSNRPPIYRYVIKTEWINDSKVISYYNPFYNVYRINADRPNEYYIVDREKKYTSETLPISPFNRKKSGIDNIKKYQNPYIGDNSNVGNLISNLPLAEYGYVFKIDSDGCGLIIDYHTTDWYSNENLYVEKSLIYNSVSIFTLIENADYITYNFSGNSYTIKRETVETNYPNYDKIDQDEIDSQMFQQYLEEKMNDNEFVERTFQKMVN